MGIDPNQLAQMQQAMGQQQGTLPDQAPAPQIGGGNPADVAVSKVLELIVWAAGKKDELNIDLMAGAINTLASAYKSLNEQQQAGPPPQQLEMEMHKAAQEMEIKQQEFKLKEAQIIHDMQLKDDAHNQENDRKNQDQLFKQGLAEQDQQHKQELSNNTLSSQHEIGMKKAEQNGKPKPSTGS